MSAPSALPPMILGYRYVRLVSSAGGYDDVHLFEDELDRPVAVKVIRDPDISPTLVAAFMSEAKTMASLEHPNIVRVYRAAQTVDGRPFIAMQLCEQQTMEDRAAGGRLSLAEVLRTGIVMGGALETAHRAGVIHRDIKPANILIQPGGAPGLTDFGVAAQASGMSNGDEVGVSIPWSPPEMLWSDSPGSVVSDVYSLAATIWHLLVGHSPFVDRHGDNRRAALMSRIRDQAPPRTGRADVPESLERTLRHAMDKRPDRRPQTALDLVHSLQVVESELRLPRTEPVVVDRRIAPSTPTADDVSATQARTSLRPRSTADVSATPIHPAPVSPAVTPTPEGPPLPDVTQADRTQLRAGSGSLDQVGTSGSRDREDATSLRPRTTQVEVPRGPDPAPAPSQRRWLIAVGAIGLVVAAVVGFALSRLGSEPGPAPSASVTVSTPVGDDAIPPGPVTVTGVAKGTSAVFTWDYSAALPTDTFRYQVDDQPPRTVTKPTVTLPVPAGHTVCVKVQVFRASGAAAQLDWSKPGCIKG